MGFTNLAFETTELTGYKTTLSSGCTTSVCSTLETSGKLLLLSGTYRLI